MKKIFFILLGTVLLASCTFTVNPEALKNAEYNSNYANASRYTCGGGTAPATIEDLEINWVSGNVVIEAYDGTEVEFSETCDKALNDTTSLYYLLDDNGTTLTIQYGRAKSKVKMADLSKDLLIRVPRQMRLEDIEVNGAGYDAVLKGIRCESLECNSVSTDITLEKCTVESVEVNGVDDKLTATFEQMPDDIELNGVNSEAVLYVPETAGMTIETAGMATDMRSELPVAKNGHKRIVGDGSCDIELNGVNCNLDVKVMNVNSE